MTKHITHEYTISIPNLGNNTCAIFYVAKRPPVEETASFLKALLASHGPNYLEKLFGSKARDALEPLGGINKVAIALSGKRDNIFIFSTFM